MTDTPPKLPKIEVYDVRHENLTTALHRIQAIEHSLEQIAKRQGRYGFYNVRSLSYTAGWTESEFKARIAEMKRFAKKHQQQNPTQTIVIYVQTYAVTCIATA